MQFVDPDPVKVLLAHVSELSDGETVDPDPLSLMEVVFETEPALAVRVTVCDAVTAETAAANGALAAPEGMVTDAGIATAVLLLARFTTTPVEGAAAVSVTVQLSVVPSPHATVAVKSVSLADAFASANVATTTDPVACPSVTSSPLAAVAVNVAFETLRLNDVLSLDPSTLLTST